MVLWISVVLLIKNTNKQHNLCCYYVIQSNGRHAVTSFGDLWRIRCTGGACTSFLHSSKREVLRLQTMTSYHPYGQQQVVSHPGFAVVPAFAPTRYAPSPVGHYHSNDVLLTPLYFKPLATVAPIDPALEFALSPTVESAQSPLLTDIERTASSDKKRKSDKKAVSICAVISSLKSVFARYESTPHTNTKHAPHTHHATTLQRCAMTFSQTSLPLNLCCLCFSLLLLLYWCCCAQVPGIQAPLFVYVATHCVTLVLSLLPRLHHALASNWQCLTHDAVIGGVVGAWWLCVAVGLLLLAPLSLPCHWGH